MQTILITGGAGFIGSHLAETLTTHNKVILLDNVSTGNKKNIPKNTVFVNAEIRKKHDIAGIFKQYKPTVVLHLAGQASTYTSYIHPMFDINTNFIGTVNMVESCVKYGIQRFLYASSMTAYGVQKTFPIKESAPCVPISYYGISKFAAERFVMATPGLLATSFRMFNVYGPRQSLTNPYQGVVAIFLGNILRNETPTVYGDGTQTRDFIYIDDVTRAWRDAIENTKSFNQSLNLGTGKKTTIKELLSALGVRKYLLRAARPGDQKTSYADMTFTKKILNFSPKISLVEGLKRTQAWSRAL